LGGAALTTQIVKGTTAMTDAATSATTTPAAGMVTGVDFLMVPVEDLDRARAFYADVVGLEAGKLWGGGSSGRPCMGAEFQAGNLTIALMDVARVGQVFRPTSGAIALRVDDVAARRAELEARGVTFITDDIDSGVCHQAFFRDSEGNALILHHRSAPATAGAEG
jgi:catechol 2,3-dioxygenase-like lactoylglutathione lyase family enzyme